LLPFDQKERLTAAQLIQCMTGKNEKKTLHNKFPGKLSDTDSKNAFAKKNFSHPADEKGEQSIEKKDEIKSRIIDYYTQLYFLS